jgi:hypothetical protein
MTKPKTYFWLILLTTLLLPGTISAQSHSPVSVSLCDLLKEPKTYDGKQIRVRGRINLEFEDFSIYDMKCNYSPDVWLMFGGDVATPIMSMWGDTKRIQGKNISFSGVEYTLAKDASFDEFFKHVTARENKKPAYRVTATLAGFFFAQRPKQDAALIGRMPGYGHMGCCRLFIIERISDVESKPITSDEYNEKWSKRREQPTRR